MKPNKIVFSEEAHNNIVEVAKLAERERILEKISKIEGHRTTDNDDFISFEMEHWDKFKEEIKEVEE